MTQPVSPAHARALRRLATDMIRNLGEGWAALDEPAIQGDAIECRIVRVDAPNHAHTIARWRVGQAPEYVVVGSSREPLTTDSWAVARVIYQDTVGI